MTELLALPVHTVDKNPLDRYGGVSSLLAGLDEIQYGGPPVLVRIDSPEKDPLPLSQVKLVDALSVFEPKYRESLEKHLIELIVKEDAHVSDVTEPLQSIVSTNDEGDRLLLVWAKVRLGDGNETVRGMEFTSHKDSKHLMYARYVRDTRTFADYSRAVDRGSATRTSLTEVLQALPEADQTWIEQHITRQVLDGHPNYYVPIEDTLPGGIYTRVTPDGVQELVFQELTWEGGEGDRFIDRAVFRLTKVAGAPAYYETKPAGMPEYADFILRDQLKSFVGEDGKTHKDFPIVDVLTSDTLETPYIDGRRVNLLEGLKVVDDEMVRTIESEVLQSILALHPRLRNKRVPVDGLHDENYTGVLVDNGEVGFQIRDGDTLLQIYFYQDVYGQIAIRADHDYVAFDEEVEYEGKTTFRQALETIDPTFSLQLQTLVSFLFVRNHPMCHTPLVGHKTYSGVYERKHPDNSASDIVIQTVGYTRLAESNEQGPVAFLRRTFSHDANNITIVKDDIRYLHPDEY